MITHAKHILQQATTPFGIVAATNAQDNYTRVWARDAVIGGLAGILIADEIVINGLTQSIITLLKAQKTLGQIPSNVGFDAKNGEVQTISYGTLAARIDAMTWFVIGAAAIADRLDEATNVQLKTGVAKAFEVLDCWEYNDRGLVYVPQGGNWADEYVLHSYTLYDQLLRAKALTDAAKVWHEPIWATKATQIYAAIAINYWQNDHTRHRTDRYRPTEADARLHIPDLPYYCAAISPSGYDLRFDLFGNALAMLTPEVCTADNAAQILSYVEALMDKYQDLIPTFYPIIYPTDPDWQLLQAHCLYRFKNEAGCFHNGGAWAMTIGWFGTAAAKWNRPDLTERLLTALKKHLKQPDGSYNLYEYISTIDYHKGGISDLTFSAAGIIMLHNALRNDK